MAKLNFTTVFLLFLFKSIYSQNFYGGEINLENQGVLSYKATVAVSIDNAVNVNSNPYFLLDWGDNSPLDTAKPIGITCGTIAYTKSYTSTHTYSTVNDYTLSCYIGNFTSGISNVPFSSNKSLTLEYFLSSNLGTNANNSPVSSSCLTNTFSVSQNTFNQNSTDSDMDSISYQLYSPPLIPGFSSSGFSINNISGLITKSNSNIGHYLIPVRSEEWRKISGINYLVGISFRYHSLIYNSIIGIHELDVSSSIKLYPSPTSSLINIVTDEEMNLRNVVIEIKNSLGQTVYSSLFTSQINLSDFSPGVYFLVIQTKYNSKTVKIVKQD